MLDLVTQLDRFCCIAVYGAFPGNGDIFLIDVNRGEKL